MVTSLPKGNKEILTVDTRRSDAPEAGLGESAMKGVEQQMADHCRQLFLKRDIKRFSMGMSCQRETGWIAVSLIKIYFLVLWIWPGISQMLDLLKDYI